MAKIELSMDYVLANEGGYGEPPFLDQPTNFGITAGALAQYRKVPISLITKHDIKILTIPEATAIYKQDYWDALSLDNIVDQGVATCIFDTGVNRGVHIGALYAQRVCNAQVGSQLLLDGVLGPLSVAAINWVPRVEFIRAYEGLVWAAYQAILQANPHDEIYRKGWQARAEKILSLV